MGILVRRTAEPIGSFDEMAVKVEMKSAKEERERMSAQIGAEELAARYDLETLKGMRLLNLNRIDAVKGAAGIFGGLALSTGLLFLLSMAESPSWASAIYAGVTVLFCLPAIAFWFLWKALEKQRDLIHNALKYLFYRVDKPTKWELERWGYDVGRMRF